jgi:hypothetical protein
VVIKKLIWWENEGEGGHYNEETGYMQDGWRGYARAVVERRGSLFAACGELDVVGEPGLGGEGVLADGRG